MNIKQGENKSFKFQIINKNGDLNEVVVSDMVFTAEQILPCGQTTKIEKKLGNGIIFDAETFYYLLNFEPDDTINAEPGNYPFDIKIRRSNLQYFVLAKGTLKIAKSYTGKI